MNWIVGWFASLSALSIYGALLIWLFVESTGFPIGDEPLLLFSGYLAAISRLNFVVVVVVCLIGKVSASCLAYAIGRQIGLARLTRPASRPTAGWRLLLYYLRPTAEIVRRTEAFFRRAGVWSVFAGRLLPVVRSFISYPAGAAGMPFPLFLLATTAGSLIWITGWTAAGALLGRSWMVAEARWGAVSWVLLAAAVLVCLGLWAWRRQRIRRSRAINAGDAPEKTST